MARKVAKKTLIVETKYGPFKCVFETEKDMGGYTVEVHGLPGALSWGKTLTEAKRMIAEAIEGAVEAKIIAKAEKEGIVQIKNSKHLATV